MKTVEKTLPPGLYFIGDPTYLGLSDSDFQQVLSGEDGVLTSEAGEQFAIFHIGADGIYGDNDGFEYGVDSACIGAYPVASDLGPELGRCVEFSEEFTVAYDEEHGLVRFGEIEILLVNVALLGEPLTRPEGMSDLDWLRELAKAGDSDAQYVLYELLKDDPDTHKEAIKWMFAAARGGYSIAQYDAGFLREWGEDHQKHLPDAVRWYRLSAEQGVALAQFKLGWMYDNGKGVPQDDNEAAKWYRLAAEQGDADAQNNLGSMYENGQGVPQDYNEAEKWYRLAAEQGHALAQYFLGVMYENGQGVPQDLIRALMWFNIAEANGDDDAREAKDDIAKKMTPAQIEKAEALAQECVRKEYQECWVKSSMRTIFLSLTPLVVVAGIILELDRKQPLIKYEPTGL